MAFVSFRLPDRAYGLSEEEARFVAIQLRRKLNVPTAAHILADKINAQADATYATGGSQDIELTPEEMQELFEVMGGSGPKDDSDAWNTLRAALESNTE